MHSPSGIGSIALLCFDVLRSDKGRDSFTFYGAKLLKHSPSQRICRAKLKFVTHANIKLWHTELCGPQFDAISWILDQINHPISSGLSKQVLLGLDNKRGTHHGAILVESHQGLLKNWNSNVPWGWKQTKLFIVKLLREVCLICT